MTPVQAALELINKGVLEVRQDGTLWRLKRRKEDKTPLKNPHKVGHPYKNYRAYGFNYKGKFRYVRIHRLVYEYFVGPIPKGKEIHHKDNNKSNNVLSNLIPITHLKNQQLAAQDGLYKRLKGEANPAVTINEKTVKSICRLLQRGYGAAYAARRLNLKYHVIYNITRGFTWRHLKCVQNLKWIKGGVRAKKHNI